MAEILIFEKIKNGNIFQTGYDNLGATGNSEIEFKMQPQTAGGIAVIYAPNGTGKTSLSDVLENMHESTEKMFIAKYNNQQITGADGKFHVIKDQINRNVIPGETADYLIGANIRREYELKKEISNGFTNAFNQLAKNFKAEYKVSKIGDHLINCIPIPDAIEYVKDIVNVKKRGKGIDKDKFIEFIVNNELMDIPDTADVDKMSFIINDYADAKLAEKILSISIGEVIANAEIAVIEQNDDAIKILNKYCHLHKCVVCDNDEYDATCLLEQKKKNRERIYESLDAKTKTLLDNIVNDISLREKDPFEIKDKVTKFITDGNIGIIQSLRQDIELSISYVTSRMLNALLNCFEGTNMLANFAEYSKILETQPQIDSEELLFIQEIISENIGPEITIIRDEENDKNFKLMLEGKEFLGVERKQLHLSTGEQNFISLAFELLLARRTDKEFVVLDDPISSFDSVYKNKIAFCIIKFLENKKQIVLTHNTDLIRLLDVQQNGCFNMYLFNNTENGNNGFIRINNEEKDILINLYKLIKLFQNQDNSLGVEIRDKRQFLMAMIPFMRGYAHISKDGDKIYTSLSKVMHGYEEGSVDAAEIYNELFGYKFDPCNISVDNILSLDCSDINILNNDRYPLLAETLRQTLIYYYLRMKVEKELVDIFHVSIRPHHPLKLNQIIRKTLGYNANDEDAEKKRDYKVFFTSRKTLLNEFNHFEGNMNIFQPAIDIESGALQKEIDAIEEKLIQLRKDYA